LWGKIPGHINCVGCFLRPGTLSGFAIRASRCLQRGKPLSRQAGWRRFLEIVHVLLSSNVQDAPCSCEARKD